MTSADVRDMLDLPVDGQPRPVKKQKTVEKRPEGVPRELYALLGERAPPVAITEHVRYRERRKWPHKVQPWAWTPFTNPARTDELVLHHWRKKHDPNAPSRQDADGVKDQISKAGASQQAGPDSGYYYAKFNVKIPQPEYTDEEYERHLKDKDWSREETDYLMTLAAEYDLRWVVIADRYEFNADAQAGPPTIQSKPRSMEDMKARYYAVAAAVMALRQPLSTMSSQELEKHEKMTAFDPNQEVRRKKMAEALLLRTPEEVKEEELLLAELKRIVTNQDRLMEERKELYARLETPQTTGNIQIHQSSQGLAQLFHTLVTADRGKKRRSVIGPGETPTSATAGPGGATTTPGSATKDGREGGHRESISGPGGAGNKKGPPQPERRRLTPQEEEMYGVTQHERHERLTSGAQFRHDKVNRLAQAKSNVQAQRVANALTELGIPPRLVMPTAKVCAEYERLMQSIHALIEVRKVSEKLEGEIKVATAQREDRERRESQSQAQLQLQLQQATSQSEQSGGGEQSFKDEDVDMQDAPEDDDAGHVDGMEGSSTAANNITGHPASTDPSHGTSLGNGPNGAMNPPSSTTTMMPPTADTAASTIHTGAAAAAQGGARDTEMTDAASLPPPHGSTATTSISDGPFATPAAVAAVASSLAGAGAAGAGGGGMKR